MQRPKIVATIDDVRVAIYTVPTDAPESDGTLERGSTAPVLVKASAGGCCGFGLSYADTTTAALIHDPLRASSARPCSRQDGRR